MVETGLHQTAIEIKTKMDVSMIAEVKKIVQEEIKTEITKQITREMNVITNSMKKLEEKLLTIENSQQLISNKFDETIQSYSKNKKQVDQRLKYLEENFKSINESLNNTRDSLYKLHCETDEIEQYLRRDYLEIVGIPTTADDNPKELVKELSYQLDIDLKDEDLSIVHRLPDSRSTKNRIIAKFVRRDKKDELFSSRNNLKGKTANCIPTVKADKNIQEKRSKIFINESLTSYRKKLFGKIYQFKKQNKFKHIWTMNGKIYLKKDDQCPTHSF